MTNIATVKYGFTHESQRNKTVEWYTPPWVFENLMLSFDLDPCHPTKRLGWIPVKNTYTIDDDGLKMNWLGNVWMNPPYGRETKAWIEKLSNHSNGIALLFARTDCAWFHNFCTKATAINFVRSRIKFIDQNGVIGNSGAGAGSMLVAFGEHNARAIAKIDGATFYL